MTENTNNAPTLGQAVDSLGCSFEIDEGDIITDVIVLAKVMTVEGRTRMSKAHSEGMSGFERAGMLQVAHLSEVSKFL